jgi:hypothetical protein
MHERFIFVSEIERAATRQILSDNFPLGKLWYVPDETDFIMDAEFPCSQETFFRYAILAPGPSGRLAFSCLYLSLLMHEPPLWMAQELRKLTHQLPAARQE